MTEIRPIPGEYAELREMPVAEFIGEIVMQADVDECYGLSEDLDILVTDWVDDWLHWSGNPDEYAEWADWVATYGDPDRAPDDPDFPSEPPIVTS